MKIRNFIVDTSDMNIEELDSLLHELKNARARKGEARARYQNFSEMIQNMRGDNLTFCSRQTGEILNPKDWVVYDSITKSTYPEEGENTDVD